MTVVSVIDIGTHSVRSLVAEVTEQQAPVILSELRIVTRLGEGLSRTGELNNLAIDRAVSALEQICHEAGKYGTFKIRAVATCAVREANNGDKFVQLVKEATGLEIEVISPAEEIGLCHRGIVDGHVAQGDKMVIADLGGGSLEVMLATGSDIETVIPTQLGAIRTTEMFDLAEPVTHENEQSARHYIAQALLEAGVPTGQEDRRLVVCGGTALALAALIDQCPIDEKLVNNASHRWDGQTVTLDEAFSIAAKLKPLNSMKRSSMTGLSPDRAAVIVAGVWALIGLMQHLSVGCFVLAVYGVRGGLLSQMATNDCR